MRIFKYLRGLAHGSHSNGQPSDLDMAVPYTFVLAIVLMGMFVSFWAAVIIFAVCALGITGYLYAVKTRGDRNIQRLDKRTRHNKAAR